MAKYIVKRVAMGIFSVFIVATLTFFIMNLVPGGPFVAEKVHQQGSPAGSGREIRSGQASGGCSTLTI